MPFLPPSQQRQSTEGQKALKAIIFLFYFFLFFFILYNNGKYKSQIAVLSAPKTARRTNRTRGSAIAEKMPCIRETVVTTVCYHCSHREQLLNSRAVQPEHKNINCN